MKFKFLPNATTTPRPELLRAKLGDEERRRCTSTRADGEPCNGWAVWDADEQLCAPHLYRTRGPELSFEERQARAKKRTRPVCSCPAYQWPHRPNNGLCRGELEPLALHPTPAGKRAAGKLRRRDVDAVRRRLGI